MPITGSQKALMQSRSAIARAGATRSGYFRPNVAITINGVDRSTSVLQDSLTITQVVGDEPDTARFLMKPESTAPTSGQTVVIGIGTAANAEFAGQVVRKRHTRRLATNQSPFIECQCVDWLRLFNRRLVNQEWSSTAADEIVTDIISTYTSGFTAFSVHPGLATIDFFPATNETPANCLSRLVALMGGGGWYIDPDRDVHFFDSTGETLARSPTAPITLTNSMDTLHAFAHESDVSQLRTYIVVEGMRTQVAVIGVPAGATSIPIEDDTIFPAFGAARIGTQAITYGLVYRRDATGIGENPVGATLTNDATAGSTSVDLTLTGSAADWGAFWMKIGNDQVVSFTQMTVGGAVTGIPASGYGSLQTDMVAGTPVSPVSSLELVETILADQPPGVEAVLRTIIDDAGAQATIAAIEGGDGRHDFLIEDGRLDDVATSQRGQQDAGTFHGEIVSAEWTTTDFNARPGRLQVINFSSPDALSTTLMITDAEVSFPTPNNPPLRRVRAGNVRLAGLQDVAITDRT